MVDAVFLGVFTIVELVVREQHLLRVREVEELCVYNIVSKYCEYSLSNRFQPFYTIKEFCEEGEELKRAESRINLRLSCFQFLDRSSDELSQISRVFFLIKQSWQ